ncbi:MAG: hypothetical protein H7249_00350 [Chitinophagaceae bacterium]|nr:hypothetical protein [Oligoflexus sp.]
MSKFEDTILEIDTLNKNLMFKKRGGGTITPEEFVSLKEMVRRLNEESKGVEIPEIGRLIQLYDLGLGVRYLEPNYDRLNAAFAWMEANEGPDGDDEDDF